MSRRRLTRNRFSNEIESLEVRVVPTADLISVNLSGTNAGDELSFGVPEFDNSRDPVRQMSSDGRYILFASNARDVSSSPIGFAGQLNQGNIYVRDRETGTTILVNASIDGKAYGDAADPSITPNGRFVVFTGASYDGRFELSPLVTGITFPPNITLGHQLYVRDLLTDTTAIVSVSPDGIGSAGNDNDVAFHASISADGRMVAFVCGTNDGLVAEDSNRKADVLVRDMITGTTTLISRNLAGQNGGNGASYYPIISADGARVTFMSDATDLTNLPDTNDQPDLFSYSLADGTVTLLSTNTAGTAAANVGVQSAFRVDDSGTKVAFLSRSTDLMNVAGLDFFNINFFLHDVTTGTTTLLSHGPSGEAMGLPGTDIGLSRDGKFATFQGDGGFVPAAPEGVSRQIYLTDTTTGQITLASHALDGTVGNADSSRPTLNEDGRYVIYSSSASNLVPDVALGQDESGSALTIFVYDRLLNVTKAVSTTAAGTTTVPTDGAFAGYYAISRDGTTMAFTSTLAGYGPTDTNSVSDVYSVVQTRTEIPSNQPPNVLDALFSLTENSADNTLVGTVNASDPDTGDTLTYSIIDGNPTGAFAINPTTGAIQVANQTVLDFETTPSFNLTVKVTDHLGVSDTASVTISLTDQPLQMLDTPFSLAENSALETVVGTISVTNPDVGDTLTFSIIVGNASGAFAINPMTGEITVANPARLDFETSPSFNLTVQATNNHGTIDTANTVISLTNVTEAPIISGGSGTVTFTKKRAAARLMPNIAIAAPEGDTTLGRVVISVFTPKGGRMTDVSFESTSTLGSLVHSGPTVFKKSGGIHTLTLTLNAGITTARVQEFLQSFAFSTKKFDPAKGTLGRYINVQVLDRQGTSSNAVSTTIQAKTN